MADLSSAPCMMLQRDQGAAERRGCVCVCLTLAPLSSPLCPPQGCWCTTGRRRTRAATSSPLGWWGVAQNSGEAGVPVVEGGKAGWWWNRAALECVGRGGFQLLGRCPTKHSCAPGSKSCQVVSFFAALAKDLWS